MIKMLMITLMLMLILILAVLIFAYVLKRRSWALVHILPPCLPGAWPVIGHLPLLAANREPLQRFLFTLAQSYGSNLFSLQLGGIPVVVISSLEPAKEFLQGHERNFAQRPKNEVSRRLLFNHKTMLTMGYGPEWRSLRKLYVAGILSGKPVAEYQGLRRAEMAERMEELVGRNMAEVDGWRRPEVELGKEIFVTVGNMMTMVLFGRRLFSEAAGCTYQETIEEVAKELGLPLMGDLVPWLFCLDHVSGRIRRLNALSGQFNSLMHDVLSPCLLQYTSYPPLSPPALGSLPSPRPPPPAAPAPDYLHLLLQLYYNDGTTGIESIIGILADFMVGGIDSTASTIKWAMAELLSNPDCMQRLQKEVDTQIGLTYNASKHAIKTIIGDAEVAKMSYLQAVVKETLRLHPPFPLLIRQLIPSLSAHQPPAKAVGIYKLPNNTSLIYNAWAVARDPQLWGANAHHFCPDRFLSSSAPLALGQHLEYVPFGMGYRGCPGRDMGFTMVPFVLANLVYRFDWSLPHDGVPLDLSHELPGAPNRLAHPLVALPTLRFPP